MQKNLTNQGNRLTLSSKNYHLRKFRILELINQLPADKANALKKDIPNTLLITRQTFAIWCNAHVNSVVDIPVTKLYIIATLLKVSILELFNEPYLNRITREYHLLPKNFIINNIGLTK